MNGSLVALAALNVFMADVRDGSGRQQPSCRIVQIGDMIWKDVRPSVDTTASENRVRGAD